MKTKLFIALALLCALRGNAQTLQDTLTKVEALFSRIKASDPGCQLALSRNGVLIFSKAWGSADLEHNIPLSTQSIIEAGSVSKQFTAAAVLLLEQQGKLSLSDKLVKHIPELPALYAGITLEQLVHHTSGIRDWGSIAGLAGWPRGSKAYSNDDALQIISQQKALNNTPGNEFIYSNSNYNLLALVVDRVSGMPMAEFTKKYIFLPAGMSHTSWRDDYKRIVPNRAIAYAKTDSGYETNMPNEYVYGNGGLLTTTEDLLRWNDYYQQGKLGSPSLFAKQTGTVPLLYGGANTYAAGLFMDKLNGENAILHDGATASYRSFLVNFPAYHLSIAFLANTSAFDDWRPNSMMDVINAFIKKVTSTVVEAPSEKTTGDASRYAGWYRNIRTGNGIEISVKEQKAYWDARQPMMPVRNGEFRSGPNSVVFTKSGLDLRTAGNDTIHYIKVEKALADLKQYGGDYYSEEVQAGGSVVMRNDTLYFRVKKDYEYPLTPSYKDGFKTPGFGNLYFERNAKNELIGLKMSGARARNVSYKKLVAGKSR